MKNQDSSISKTVVAQHYASLAYILKTETASSSETSPTVCRLTQNHSPEDLHIQSTPSNTLLSIFLFALPLTYQGQEKKHSACGGGKNRFSARDNRITLDPRPSPPSGKATCCSYYGSNLCSYYDVHVQVMVARPGVSGLIRTFIGDIVPH